MNKKFVILKIDYNHLNSHGDVFLVYANPATPNPVIEGYYLFTDSVCPETEIFIFPQDMDIIRPIDQLCRQNELWEPDEFEFRPGGLTLPDNVRHTAHYHESLFDDTPAPTIINYKAEEITFNNQDWIKFDEPQDWDFSVDEIATPYGYLDIEGYMEVQQNGLVGVQLAVSGYLYFADIPGYPGEDAGALITTVAVMRQPENLWLWVYLFDENQNPVASVCGLEGDVMDNELSNFVTALKKRSRK